MPIQVNTDKNISGQEPLAQGVDETLDRVLANLAGQITRRKVHLSDENSTPKSDVLGKRRLLEARLAGREPTSVSDSASTIEQSARGAAHETVSLPGSELGKLGKDWAHRAHTRAQSEAGDHKPAITSRQSVARDQ